MKARVGLNGRFSHAKHPVGTHVASFHLFDAILRAPRDLDLVVFADPEAPGVGEWRNLPGVVFCPVPFRSWSRLKMSRHKISRCITPALRVTYLTG